MMSPEALDVAISALEAEQDQARDWLRASETNAETAAGLVGRAEEQLDDARNRVQRATEALEWLQGRRSVTVERDDDELGRPHIIGGEVEA